MAGGGLDLLAQVLDVGVDRPLVGLEGDAVDRVQELAAGEHPARLADHGGQELELGRGELDRPAADRDPHAGKVDLDVGDPRHLRPAGRCRLGPPQDGPDPGHELLGAERLDHVVVGAKLQADDPVGLVPPGGQHHDRHVGGPAQAAGHVQPVPPGQPQVEDDQVGPGPTGLGQRHLPVARDHHLEPGVLEVVPDQPGDLALVLDDQDPLHFLPARPKPDEAAGRRNPPPRPGARRGAGPAVPGYATPGRPASPWCRPGGASPERPASGAARGAGGGTRRTPPGRPRVREGRTRPGRLGHGPQPPGPAPPGTAPAPAPERAPDQQHDPDHEQREQDQPEREAEPAAVAPPVAVPPDDPDHLVGAALGQLAGDPLVDPGVEGRDPIPTTARTARITAPITIDLRIASSSLTALLGRSRCCRPAVKEL